MNPQKIFSRTRKWFTSKEKPETRVLGRDGEGLIHKDFCNFNWSDVGRDHLKLVPYGKAMIKEHMEYMKSYGVKFICHVGVETYGHLFRVKLKYENRILICKVLSLQTFDWNKFRLTTVRESLRAMYHEINILRHPVLKHNFIVQMLYNVRIPDSKTGFPYSGVCMLMEYTDGTLIDLILRTTEGVLLENDCLEWFCQISERIRYLHHKNIVHMNIRPESIRFVMGPHKTYKLSDFCHSLSFGEGKSSWVNDVRIEGIYQSPEVRRQIHVPYFDTKANDIWGLGLTLIACLIGPETDPQVMIDGLRFGEWSYNQMYTRYMPFPPSPHLSEVMAQMVETNPIDRPHISEICRYCWEHLFKRTDTTFHRL